MTSDEARDVLALARVLERTCLVKREERDAWARLLKTAKGEPEPGSEPPTWERLARGSKP